jgi:predicted O-linked N-acetylglucosamine transferase (SPINDLY family)
MTRQLQEYADDWVDCVELSDEKLADKIRADQIDILVDLSRHTGGNRLLVFARKPAPVQLSYMGCPNTTGLTAIDYRLTDTYCQPPENFSSEAIIKMPDTSSCYCPLEDSPPVNELPCLENSYVTFGSFNICAKMNPKILALWAEVLNTVSDSKLLLKTKALSDELTREALKEQFAQWGIAPDRLFFEMFEPAPAYLESYWKVDIGLDTYPYNGSTTTYEALWMGISVVTLAGDTEASWSGLSTLSTLGLTELIAYTPEQYVDICVKLASDTDYLKRLRASMRERMLASPLMDYVNFTHHLEAEYRKMWEKWCR